MAELIYDNGVVEGHSLYLLCGSTLNEVSKRDYPASDYFNSDIQCLDMDTYEKTILRKSHAEHTVDAVIGISTYENNQALNPRLLLIELRMGYKNVSNLSKTEMERKVTHTKSLLGGEKTIERESVFLFDKTVASQAERWFDRQSRTGGELKDCKVCSVSDFSTIIKSISDFPYKPIHKAEDIKSSVRQYAAKSEWIKFIEQITYWCDEAEKYYYKNPSEFSHITHAIKSIWDEFKQQKHILSDDEKLKSEILEEDFEFLK